MSENKSTETGTSKIAMSGDAESCVDSCIRVEDVYVEKLDSKVSSQFESLEDWCNQEYGCIHTQLSELNRETADLNHAFDNMSKHLYWSDTERIKLEDSFKSFVKEVKARESDLKRTLFVAFCIVIGIDFAELLFFLFCMQ